MDNKIINSLANDIIIKLKGNLDIEVEMRNFLNSNISIENKEKVIEILCKELGLSREYVEKRVNKVSSIEEEGILKA